MKENRIPFCKYYEVMNGKQEPYSIFVNLFLIYINTRKQKPYLRKYLWRGKERKNRDAISENIFNDVGKEKQGR
jgi:hypothetical protein